jgi:hypothetical protein
MKVNGKFGNFFTKSESARATAPVARARPLRQQYCARKMFDIWPVAHVRSSLSGGKDTCSCDTCRRTVWDVRRCSPLPLQATPRSLEATLSLLVGSIEILSLLSFREARAALACPHVRFAARLAAPTAGPFSSRNGCPGVFAPQGCVSRSNTLAVRLFAGRCRSPAL